MAGIRLGVSSQRSSAPRKLVANGAPIARAPIPTSSVTMPPACCLPACSAASVTVVLFQAAITAASSPGLVIPSAFVPSSGQRNRPEARKVERPADERRRTPRAWPVRLAWDESGRDEHGPPQPPPSPARAAARLSRSMSLPPEGWLLRAVRAEGSRTRQRIAARRPRQGPPLSCRSTGEVAFQSGRRPARRPGAVPVWASCLRSSPQATESGSTHAYGHCHRGRSAALVHRTRGARTRTGRGPSQDHRMRDLLHGPGPASGPVAHRPLPSRPGPRDHRRGGRYRSGRVVAGGRRFRGRPVPRRLLPPLRLLRARRADPLPSEAHHGHRHGTAVTPNTPSSSPTS